MKIFLDTITKAVADILEHGYDSPDRIAYWSQQIRAAALANMAPEHRLEQALREALLSIYRRLIDRGAIVRQHPGVARFTIERLAPQLRTELDRRIMASANLIRLNRQGAIQRTLQRFEAWSTSIPAGGSPAAKRPVKDDMRKALASLPFEERRVIIDQGHKLRSSLSEIIAVNANAIAGTWHSHWRQAGYNYRPQHKERDGLVYLVRGSWALDKGFIKPGDAGYTDDVTKPGEEIYCRCYYQWHYNVRELPNNMVTALGRRTLEEIRRAMGAAA